MNGVSGEPRRTRRVSVVIIALVLGLAVVPSVALAETRASGSVVVEADETVEGDLDVVGGSVTIDGTVEGDVRAFGGSVRIDGRVEGDVSASAGSIIVGPEATITGSLDGAGGTATIRGRIHGPVTIGAGTVELAETAILDRDLEYDGTLSLADGATIRGAIIETSGHGVAAVFGLPLPQWLPPVYPLLAGLFGGLFLLAVFPRFSTTVGKRVAGDPLTNSGAGLLALFGIPAVLAVVAITVVGIPLALLGLVGYVSLLWIGSLYGRYAVGEYLLSQSAVDNRWAALLVGFLVVAGLVRVPLVGGLFQLIVLLLGLGGVVEELSTRYRRSDEQSNTR